MKGVGGGVGSAREASGGGYSMHGMYHMPLHMPPFSQRSGTLLVRVNVLCHAELVGQHSNAAAVGEAAVTANVDRELYHCAVNHHLHCVRLFPACSNWHRCGGGGGGGGGGGCTTIVAEWCLMCTRTHQRGQQQKQTWLHEQDVAPLPMLQSGSVLYSMFQYVCYISNYSGSV